FQSLFRSAVAMPLIIAEQTADHGSLGACLHLAVDAGVNPVAIIVGILAKTVENLFPGQLGYIWGVEIQCEAMVGRVNRFAAGGVMSGLVDITQLQHPPDNPVAAYQGPLGVGQRVIGRWCLQAPDDSCMLR